MTHECPECYRECRCEAECACPITPPPLGCGLAFDDRTDFPVEEQGEETEDEA